MTLVRGMGRGVSWAQGECTQSLISKGRRGSARPLQAEPHQTVAAVARGCHTVALLETCLAWLDSRRHGARAGPGPDLAPVVIGKMAARSSFSVVLSPGVPRGLPTPVRAHVWAPPRSPRRAAAWERLGPCGRRGQRQMSAVPTPA